VIISGSLRRRCSSRLFESIDAEDQKLVFDVIDHDEHSSHWLRYEVIDADSRFRDENGELRTKWS